GATYKVPAAGDNPDGWTPQWGILKLEFSVGAPTTKRLEVIFNTDVEDSKASMENKFLIVTEGMNPFELTQNLIDLRELTERSQPRTFEVISFYSTPGPLSTGPAWCGA